MQNYLGYKCGHDVKHCINPNSTRSVIDISSLDNIVWLLVTFISDHLSPITSLVLTAQNSNIFLLTWEAPSSLLPVTYCITITNSSSLQEMYSQCGLNTTTFIYPMPPRSGCDIYLFTVYPVNANGNGDETTISYIGAQAGIVTFWMCCIASCSGLWLYALVI